MRRMTTRRIVIAGATAGAVLLTGGVAFAFWSSTGTGDGTAGVASTAAELTVTQIGTPGGLVFIDTSRAVERVLAFVGDAFGADDGCQHLATFFNFVLLIANRFCQRSHPGLGGGLFLS